MSLSARAASIRGDDYQHAIAWYWACEMLRDPDIISVSVEDPAGGAFDDVVILRHTGVNTYIQAKSSNYGDKTVNQEWLFAAKGDAGKSPLQRFYETYVELSAVDKPFVLEVWTNRSFEEDNPLLGKLLDQATDTISVKQMLDATARSKIGRERKAWASHLGINEGPLASFLESVRWKQAGSQSDWHRQAIPLMEIAGLRSDDQAVEIGVAIVRHWVTHGAGPQSADDVRAAVGAKDLLARTGTLVFAVHAIDRDPTPTQPNVEVDFVELFEGDNSFNRKLLKDHDDWEMKILPAIEDAARRLAAYRVRSVHVTGSLRHPLWFAVGRALPEVKRWELSLDLVDSTWSTTDPQVEVAPRVLADIDVGSGDDVAAGIALTGDLTGDVEAYIRQSQPSIGRLIVFGPEAEPSHTAVPSGGWAMAWTRAVREEIRKGPAAEATGRIHMFFQCPAGIALMLGHQWNVMPPTTVYEFANGSYHPTISAPGI